MDNEPNLNATMSAVLRALDRNVALLECANGYVRNDLCERLANLSATLRNTAQAWEVIDRINCSAEEQS